jgi:hypothetical protein
MIIILRSRILSRRDIYPPRRLSEFVTRHSTGPGTDISNTLDFRRPVELASGYPFTADRGDSERGRDSVPSCWLVSPCHPVDGTARDLCCGKLVRVMSGVKRVTLTVFVAGMIRRFSRARMRLIGMCGGLWAGRTYWAKTKRTRGQNQNIYHVTHDSS